MIIKRLPYPMYYDGSPDYFKTSLFVDMDISADEDPLHILVKGYFDIDDKEITNYIELKQAEYALLIECTATNYKELRKCHHHFSEKLIKANFTESLTITPMIVATEDIDNYTHSNLIDNYKLIKVTVPKGGIIAFDDEYEITIARGTPEAVKSICKFILGDNDYDHYTFDENAIYIPLPENVYFEYKENMDRYQRTSLTAMYFPPVLVDLIKLMYIEENPEVCDYSNSKWFMAIDNVIQEMTDNPKDLDPYDAAMMIINGLMADGSAYLNNSEVNKL